MLSAFLGRSAGFELGPRGPVAQHCFPQIEPVRRRARLMNRPPFGAAYRGSTRVRLAIPRYHDFGLAAAVLAICFGVYGGFAVGFHWLMQPTRAQNPGLAAYSPPPKTVVDYTGSSFVPPAPSAPIAPVALAEPAPDVLESPTIEPKKETKRQHARPRRERPVIERRNPWDFASRPSHGGYRPWF